MWNAIKSMPRFYGILVSDCLMYSKEFVKYFHREFAKEPLTEEEIKKIDDITITDYSSEKSSRKNAVAGVSGNLIVSFVLKKYFYVFIAVILSMLIYDLIKYGMFMLIY